MGFLTGKTAIITGAGRAVLEDGSCGSIGYGIATAYAKEGANLVITGRNVKKLEAAKEELERLLYSGNKIILYDLGRDKYFRLLASVKVGNIDVAEYMINRGLAKSYNGGAKLKPTE